MYSLFGLAENFDCIGCSKVKNDKSRVAVGHEPVIKNPYGGHSFVLMV